MVKTKSLITEAAARAAASPLVSRAWSHLEKQAEHAIKASERPRTEVQIVCARGRTSGRVTSPGLNLVIEDGDFALRISDEKE